MGLSQAPAAKSRRVAWTVPQEVVKLKPELFLVINLTLHFSRNSRRSLLNVSDNIDR